MPETVAVFLDKYQKGPLPEFITYVPPQQCLLLYGKTINLKRKAVTEEERRHNPVIKANEFLQKHSFKACGPCLNRNLISLSENETDYSYHIIRVPVI